MNALKILPSEMSLILILSSSSTSLSAGSGHSPAGGVSGRAPREGKGPWKQEKSHENSPKHKIFNLFNLINLFYLWLKANRCGGKVNLVLITFLIGGIWECCFMKWKLSIPIDELKRNYINSLALEKLKKTSKKCVKLRIFSVSGF